MFPSSRQVSVQGWLAASVTGRVLLFVGNCLKEFAAAHKMRRGLLQAERELARMSDLDLADIGLGPADSAAILEAAYAARARGAAGWLASWGRSLAAMRAGSLLASTGISGVRDPGHPYGAARPCPRTHTKS